MQKKSIFIPQKQFLESQQNALVTKTIVCFFLIDGAFLVDFLYTQLNLLSDLNTAKVVASLKKFKIDFDKLLPT